MVRNCRREFQPQRNRSKNRWGAHSSYVSEGIEQAQTVVRFVDGSFLLALISKGRYESLEFLTDAVLHTFQWGTIRHDTFESGQP